MASLARLGSIELRAGQAGKLITFYFTLLSSWKKHMMFPLK